MLILTYSLLTLAFQYTMNKKKIMNLEKVTSWIQYGVNLMKYTDTALLRKWVENEGGFSLVKCCYITKHITPPPLLALPETEGEGGRHLTIEHQLLQWMDLLGKKTVYICNNVFRHTSSLGVFTFPCIKVVQVTLVLRGVHCCDPVFTPFLVPHIFKDRKMSLNQGSF